MTVNHHRRDTLGEAIMYMTSFFTVFAKVAERLTCRTQWNAPLTGIFAKARAGTAT